MVLQFANGGVPANANDPYQGETYTTGTELLTLINDTLVAAGWTVKSGVPATPPLLLEGTLGTDKCWMEFTILNDSTLQVRGDALGDGSILSDDRIVSDFVNGQENIVFITADIYAFGLALFPFSGSSDIIHGGFCERLDPTDDTCIYIGKVFTAIGELIHNNISFRHSNAYSMCMVHTHSLPTEDTNNPGTFLNWESLEKGYVPESSTFSSTDSIRESYQLPLYTVLNKNSLVGEASTTFTAASGTNIAYFSHIGDNDPRNNIPVAGDYYYLEAPNTPADYNKYGDDQGLAKAHVGACRGNIAFIISGMSHLTAMSQWDGQSGNVYITAGQTFQGMRIA